MYVLKITGIKANYKKGSDRLPFLNFIRSSVVWEKSWNLFYKAAGFVHNITLGFILHASENVERARLRIHHRLSRSLERINKIASRFENVFSYA